MSVNLVLMEVSVTIMYHRIYVVVLLRGWVKPVIQLITVRINPVKIMPRVQIMEIHTRANVVTDGLEQNVNLKIFVYVAHVKMAVNVQTTVVAIYVLVLKDGAVKTVVTLTIVLVILVKIVDAVSILKAHFHAHVLMDGVVTLVKQRQSVTVLHAKMEVRVKAPIVNCLAYVNLVG